MEDNNSNLKLVNGSRGKVVTTKKIALQYSHDNENVIYSVRQLAHDAGFSSTDEVMVATAASELATNMLKYAGGGEMTVCVIQDIVNRRMGIELFAADEGPGIADISLAMQERYTTIPSSLGLGLPSVNRIMDEFYIESLPGVGTRVLAYKWRAYEKF